MGAASWSVVRRNDYSWNGSHESGSTHSQVQNKDSCRCRHKFRETDVFRSSAPRHSWFGKRFVLNVAAILGAIKSFVGGGVEVALDSLSTHSLRFCVHFASN